MGKDDSREYFTKVSDGGMLWEIWYRYLDGRMDNASLAHEWQALRGVRFWNLTKAMRVCAALEVAYNDGLWLTHSRDPIGGKEL